MSLAAVILAAGASRRMGRPKALLPFRGETVLDRLIGLYSRFASPVIVVLGHHAEAIRAGIARGGTVRFAVNPDPERGQLSSLQCGLQAVPAGSGVLFTPVDYASVDEHTVAELVREFDAREGATPLMAPAYRGAHGHPVLIGERLKDELLALGPDATARDVLGRYRAAAFYLDVDDEGVVTDLDRPEDYERLVARERGAGARA